MLEGKYWKNGVPKAIKLTFSRNMSRQKQSENAGKRTQKKCRRKMNWKETKKMGWNENEEKQGRKTKAELVLHEMKNDPWSNYPKTQLGPTYSLFRNHKPWPTLRTWKVYFDRMWILRLKRFSWENFSWLTRLLFLFFNQNHLDKLFTRSRWILNFWVHNGTIKQKEK